MSAIRRTLGLAAAAAAAEFVRATSRPGVEGVEGLLRAGKAAGRVMLAQRAGTPLQAPTKPTAAVASPAKLSSPKGAPRKARGPTGETVRMVEVDGVWTPAPPKARRKR